VKMTVTYCTSDNVASFLGVTAFADGATPTVPNKTFVELLINASESEIDEFTGRSWRGARYSGYLRKGVYNGEFTEYHLHEKGILTLATLSLDSMKVWDGATYSEWVGVKTESRAGDYWIDYTRGILYVKGDYSDENNYILISYRVGSSSTLPEAIKLACMMLTASRVIMQDDRSVTLPEGTSNISLPEKQARWRKEAFEICEQFIEITVY